MLHSYFVRYDASGRIVSSGVMETRHIEAERAAGGLILALKTLPPLDGYVVRDGALVKAAPAA